MLDSIAAAQMLRGVRGSEPVSRKALADVIRRVSDLVSENPEISEVDLNPVFADARGATAADVRILVDFNPAPVKQQYTQDEILSTMRRVMKPTAVAVVGALAAAPHLRDHGAATAGHQAAASAISAARIGDSPC